MVRFSKQGKVRVHETPVYKALQINYTHPSNLKGAKTPKEPLIITQLKLPIGILYKRAMQR